jgi:23S rRNA (adenine2503-C2)-methyltransferase
MQRSADGTVKNALRLHDGLIVESVLIPTESRTTACVSSQVGCSLDCSFCATAQLKKMRNLNPDEIYDQVAAINKESLLYYNHKLSNIVFMGMGEPLMNYNNVLKAIEKITSEEGLNSQGDYSFHFWHSKNDQKLADDEVNLTAISLFGNRRVNQIMPLQKGFSLQFKGTLGTGMPKQTTGFLMNMLFGTELTTQRSNGQVNFCNTCRVR